MDPSSTSFVPRDDFWKVQADMTRLQHIQATHTERLSRLEQRNDDDARTKSIWGSSSPFPSLLGGTPQQVPVQQPPVDAFSGFDDQPTHLIGSLHLDADDEPRRVGATSRANSVRFDETANQGHWSHPNRSSLELLPRSGSSLGSHPMIERTYSHKSDGRQSSTGHSVHSVASRANSMGIDTLNGLGATSDDVPPFTPGLLLLGSVPAIIRCWLTTKFKHETLLYAAVCSGSYASLISRDLIESLNFSDRIRQEEDGSLKVKLSVYLPEASVRSASSRSNSPVPQLPNIAIDFKVVSDWDVTEKSIRVIIGSDVLRSRNADILFSSSTMTLYDDDRCKLSTPLVRPEDEQAFNGLQTFSHTTKARPSTAGSVEQPSNSSVVSKSQKSSPQVLPTKAEESVTRLSTDSTSSRPSLGLLMAQQQTSSTSDNTAPTSTPRSSTQPPSPAVWTSWRRDTTEPKNEWGKSSSPSTYQRREQGIKVLRPSVASKAAASAVPTRSTSATAAVAEPPKSMSRFFDDGKRRVNGDDSSSSSSVKKGLVAKEVKSSVSSNPVGEGSAFPWLNK